MGKVIKLSSEKGKEERLKEILDNLEEVKNNLAENGKSNKAFF